jgi:hypothetical protein
MARTPESGLNIVRELFRILAQSGACAAIDNGMNAHSFFFPPRFLDALLKQ